MSLSIGDEILQGKYRIEKAIGEGAFGKVYLAEDVPLRRQVAIKELRREDWTDEQYVEFRRRFQREAQIGAALRHDNIVQVYTLEPSAEDFYLVMEYVDGPSLAQRLEQEGPLPLEEAVEMATQLCDGLAAVHDHSLGIVHRDIKPSNILLTGQGEPKITDFGLAQLHGESLRSLGKGARHPGTPAYMSPEQETSSGYLRPASDIYSLGCVLFEMLTGKVYKRVQGSEPSRWRDDLPSWLDDVLAEMLAEDPVERYRAVDQVKADLKEGHGARTVTGRIERVLLFVVTAAQAIGTTWAIVVVIAGILGLVGTGLVLWPKHTPTPVPDQTPPATPGAPAVTPTLASPTRTPQPPPPMPAVTPASTPSSTGTSSPTSTMSSVVFQENFEGPVLDPAEWTLDTGSGAASLSDGVLELRSSGRRYPYVYTSNDLFPRDEDFQITTRFRYREVRVCGVGVIVTSCQVPVGLAQKEAEQFQQDCEEQGITAGVWQDRENGLQLWFRSGSDRIDVPFPGPNTSWNEMTITYSDGRYHLYLDGGPAYVSQPTSYRPQLVWIGHPASLDSDCQWDTLQVDYIRVENTQTAPRLTATPTRTPTLTPTSTPPAATPRGPAATPTPAHALKYVQGSLQAFPNCGTVFFTGYIRGLSGEPINGRTVRLRFADNVLYKTSGVGEGSGSWGFAPLAPNMYHSPFTFLIDVVVSESDPRPQSDTVTIDFINCEVGGQFENIVFQYLR